MIKQMVDAMVNSLKGLAEVEIVEHKDNNHCLARYNGKLCTAIFNSFSGYYYVDDIFAVIERENSESIVISEDT